MGRQGDERQPSSVYRVDGEDRIRFVSPGWLDFALENGAPELTRERVVGAVLWNFVAGEETRRLYQLLFAKVREERSEVAIPFRCDSPDVRRFMRLALAPLSDGGVELEAVLLREERRRYVTLLDPAAARSETHVVVCSWCKNVFLFEAEWVPVEEAEKGLDLTASGKLPGLSYGVCPACEAEVEGELYGEGGA